MYDSMNAQQQCSANIVPEDGSDAAFSEWLLVKINPGLVSVWRLQEFSERVALHMICITWRAGRLLADTLH